MGLDQSLNHHHHAPERTAAAALVGARGLQAQGNNTNYVQYNFGTAASPATRDLRREVLLQAEREYAHTGKDIFVAATTTDLAPRVFRVRYRLNAGRRRCRSRWDRQHQHHVDQRQ